MTALTADTVRSLTGFRGVGGPVVSLYLNVDGQRYVRPQDYEAELGRLLRRARDKPGPVAEADLRRVESRVKARTDRSNTKGLALFSCVADRFFEDIELPVAVRNQLVVNQTPHVRQLEAVLERHQRLGVLLVDRQRAKMLVFEFGQLRDQSELFDQLPRHDDDRGDWTDCLGLHPCRRRC